MKCPLRSSSYQGAYDQAQYEDLDCLEEECAWWYKENNTCAVLTLAQGSSYIHKELLAIRDKMPHEKQFRK